MKTVHDQLTEAGFTVESVSLGKECDFFINVLDTKNGDARLQCTYVVEGCWKFQALTPERITYTPEFDGLGELIDHYRKDGESFSKPISLLEYYERLSVG